MDPSQNLHAKSQQLVLVLNPKCHNTMGGVFHPSWCGLQLPWQQRGHGGLWTQRGLYFSPPHPQSDWASSAPSHPSCGHQGAPEPAPHDKGTVAFYDKVIPPGSCPPSCFEPNVVTLLLACPETPTYLRIYPANLLMEELTSPEEPLRSRPFPSWAPAEAARGCGNWSRSHPLLQRDTLGVPRHGSAPPCMAYIPEGPVGTVGSQDARGHLQQPCSRFWGRWSHERAFQIGQSLGNLFCICRLEVRACSLMRFIHASVSRYYVQYLDKITLSLSGEPPAQWSTQIQ